jgi:peroxiredoxin Q/BCP
MAQLRQDFAKFSKRGATILVVGPEGTQDFARYWRQHQLPFTGLSDPTSKVLRLYGQEINLFKLGRMPAQVLIDKNGIVRNVYYGHSMSDIPANSDVLAILDEIIHTV